MFTGIIEEIGTVRSIARGSNSARLTIRANAVLADTRTGDSIAVNGACLTVTKVERDLFHADVMNETLEQTSIGKMTTGNRVNLERALTLSKRIGGHLVSGHIDGTGEVVGITTEGIAKRMTIKVADELLRFILLRGSVAIDGASLTVCALDRASFDVGIIPHTATNTTLAAVKKGDTVNIECDVVAKYIERLLVVNGQCARDGRLDEAALERLIKGGL
jgi:riboflavin synthase